MANGNRTQIKTRFGQIMEAITGIALARAGFSFHSDWEYESSSMKVDFAIPENEQPNFIIEVTQTEARNIIQRKLLRYFELVAEAKVNFQESLSVITLIYGTPTRDLPEPNLKASLIFFDAAFLPRVDRILSDKDKAFLQELEEQALSLASRLTNRDEAVAQLETEYSEGIDVLTRYFRQEIPEIQANSLLTQIWNLEKERVSQIQITQDIRPIETYYKKGILQALFLTEEEFRLLLEQITDPESTRINIHPEQLDLSAELLNRLIQLGVATVTESTAAPEIHLSRELRTVLESSNALEMIRLAQEKLRSHSMRHFFEDIQDQHRREFMAERYLEITSQGKESLQEAIFQNLSIDDYCGIQHSRCWIADFIPFHLNQSQNYLSGQIVKDPRYTANTGKPFNDIVMKFQRIMTGSESLHEHAMLAADLWNSLPKQRDITIRQLSNNLLQARIEAAMYLQKFNPLYLVIESAFFRENWEYEYKGIESIFGDLLNKKSVGRFSVYRATKGDQTIVLNALQITDAHKPDEWAARGRALRYRLQQNLDGTQQVIQQLEDAHFVFVLDGKLTVKMRKRLEQAGWRTCTLDEFPDVLRAIA